MEKKNTSLSFPSICFSPAELVHHMSNLSFQTEVFILKTSYSRCCFSNLCRKFYRNLTVLVIDHIQIIHNSLSTDHSQADSLMEIFDCKDLDCSDFSCMRDMRSTAGTEIRSRETYQTHLSGQFFLASVGKFLQFFF